MKIHQHSVLIVDDTLENLRVLGEILEQDGHEVLIASDGRQALDIAFAMPPDLVLLDVMMPGMDGYEVCRKLKGNAATAEVPIIFLTALNDESDEGKGLDLGAVDYIPKPFKIGLVRKRINNHLAFQQLKSELRVYTTSLEKLVGERTQQLSEVHERLQVLDATKALYLRIISEEIKAPANGIIGIGQLALLNIEDKSKSQRLQALFDSNKNRLNEILHNSLKIVELQNPALKAPLHPVRIEEVFDQACERVAQELSQKQVAIPSSPNGSWIVAGDRDLLLQALTVILQVAIVLSEQEVSIDHEFGDQDHFVCLTLRAASSVDLKRRIANLRELVLVPSASEIFQSMGLTLPLAGAVIQSLGGAISISYDAQKGFTLTLTLPKYQPV